MDRAEFDKFADEYAAMHGKSIRASGEGPEFFAEYKVRDVAGYISGIGLSAGSMLDFGSGIGGSVPYIKKYLPNFQLSCVDVSERSLDIARGRFPGAAQYLQFDGASLPFGGNTFDLVFTACVFHHIPAGEHVALLTEIRRVMKPDGIFFIFEHNPLNPLTVRVMNQCPFDENAVLIRADQLKARLLRAGFSECELRYRVFFPRFLRHLRRLEAGLAWLPAGAQYYLAARQ